MIRNGFHKKTGINQCDKYNRADDSNDGAELESFRASPLPANLITMLISRYSWIFLRSGTLHLIGTLPFASRCVGAHIRILVQCFGLR